MPQIVVVTVVKSNPIGLKQTFESLLPVKNLIHWIIVTPFDNSLTHQLAETITEEGQGGFKLLKDSGCGIYPAMNLVLPVIRDNQWVWFLNAGDTLFSDTSFQSVVKQIERTDANWVYGHFELSDSDNQRIGIYFSPSSFSVTKQLFALRFVSHQATFVKASALKKLGGFDTRFKVAADWHLICRLALLEDGQYIDAVIARFTLGGYSSQNRALGNLELLKIRWELLSNSWQILSLLWFIYRSLRIFVLQWVENLAKGHMYKVRRVRFRILHSWFGSKS